MPFGSDLVAALILAHLFDSESLFYHKSFPRDVMRETLQHFVPSAHSRLLTFLNRVKREIDFKTYTAPQMDRLFDDYILFWLLMRSCAGLPISDPRQPKPPFVPSLPVQALWFSHMLQSDDYVGFMLAVFSGGKCDQYADIPLRTCCHPLCLDPGESAALEEITKERWCEWYNPELAATKRECQTFVDLKDSLMMRFTPAMLVDDQDWLDEFNSFTYGTDVFSKRFLEKAHLGYQRMLYLKWKSDRNMHHESLECMHFAPCPAVDLIWHSHLMMPQCYATVCFESLIENDMATLLGYSPRHKLLEKEDRSLHFMGQRESKEERLWFHI